MPSRIARFDERVRLLINMRFVRDGIYAERKFQENFRGIVSCRVSGCILMVGPPECVRSGGSLQDYRSVLWKPCQKLRIRNMVWAVRLCRSFNRNSWLDTKQADLFYRFRDNTAALNLYDESGRQWERFFASRFSLLRRTVPSRIFNYPYIIRA